MNYPREFHPAKYRFHMEKKCVTDCPYCACGWDENVREAGRVYVDPTGFSGNFKKGTGSTFNCNAGPGSGNFGPQK